MHNNESWLESALRRDLSKVEAPPELSERVLWERVRRPATAAETRRPLAWALGAVLFVAAGVLGLRSHEPHAAGLSELQSGDPAQISAWVKTRTGMVLPLPDTLQPSVRLLGARVVDPGVPSVEVSYEAGDREATLLVSRTADATASRHADLRAVNNDSKVSWIAHGQCYTLSCARPEDVRVACLLCHAS